MANVRAFLDFDSATFRDVVKYSNGQLSFVRDHFMKSNFTWLVRDDFEPEVQGILLRMSDDMTCWDAKRVRPNMDFLMEAVGQDGVIAGTFNGVSFEVSPQEFFDKLLLPEWTGDNIGDGWKALGEKVGYTSSAATVYVQDRYVLANREGWKASLESTLVSHVMDIVEVNGVESLHAILVFEAINLPAPRDGEAWRPYHYVKEATRKLDWLVEKMTAELSSLGCKFSLQAHMIHRNKGSQYHDRYLVWNQFTLSMGTGLSVQNEAVRLWYNVGKADNIDLTTGQVGRFWRHLEQDEEEEKRLEGDWGYHGVCRPIKTMEFNFIGNWAYPWKKRERLNWPAFNIS